MTFPIPKNGVIDSIEIDAKMKNVLFPIESPIIKIGGSKCDLANVFGSDPDASTCPQGEGDGMAQFYLKVIAC